MNRTAFLVDGFNLYHSLRTAGYELGMDVRWLNLHSLLSSYLSAIGMNTRLASIHYFSALAHHLEERQPGVTHRHRRWPYP